jgi:hypothetical protein
VICDARATRARSSSVEHTLNTLRYADRVKGVRIPLLDVWSGHFVTHVLARAGSSSVEHHH